MRGVHENFASVRTPVVALNALDDRWAPPASRDAFMAACRNAPLCPVDLVPRSLGLRSIGHRGRFRPTARPLRDETPGWFAEPLPA